MRSCELPNTKLSQSSPDSAQLRRTTSRIRRWTASTSGNAVGPAYLSLSVKRDVIAELLQLRVVTGLPCYVRRDANLIVGGLPQFCKCYVTLFFWLHPVGPDPVVAGGGVRVRAVLKGVPVGAGPRHELD